MITLPPHLAKLSGTLNPTPMMNYTTKLYELDEAKTIRTYHMEMMKKLIERINLCITFQLS